MPETPEALVILVCLGKIWTGAQANIQLAVSRLPGVVLTHTTSVAGIIWQISMDQTLFLVWFMDKTALF